MITALAIQGAQQFYDTLFYKSSELFLANSNNIDQIYTWFNDEESKILYGKCIRNTLLAQVLGEKRAHSLIPIFSDELLERAKQIAITNKDQFPILFTHVDEDIDWINASMYVLNQYQYKDIVKIEQGDSFIDCGALYGETSLWAARKGAKNILTFEPNPECYELVVKNFSNPENLPSDCIATPIKAGIANENGYINFLQCAKGGSRITDESPETNPKVTAVPVVSIDGICAERNFQPNFIKMDIEGLEYYALVGAQKTIQSKKPKLAISIYHRPEDLWTIPLYIKNLVPEYKFYLKKSHTLFETILFATI